MFIFIGLIVSVCWVVLLEGSVVLGAIMGIFAGWVYYLSARLKRLQIQHQQLAEQLGHLQAEFMHDAEIKASATVVAQNLDTTQAEAALNLDVTQAEAAQNLDVTPAETAASGLAAGKPADSLPPATPVEPDFMTRGFDAAKDWLLGGNPFVRAGIILLFIGFVFLLRYSLENNLISIELRLLGSAGMALLLLISGWRLRKRAGAYGLILQAGGIGLLYLTVFGAFSLYQLIPALPAFALLVIIVAAGVMLAVLQNSLALAMFATAGGFLAPILIASGSNNYIGLFTFYAMLNVGIFAVAWFKAWRLLNLLGFVFTFAIASMWGWSSYQPANFPTLQPFLIFFFLLYVLIAILFALRTPVNFKDKVDSTLVFGTPILGFGLQIALVNQFEYGIAISAFVLGGFYLLLAGVMWKRYGKSQRLLCETFVVLGVIFTTLSIPFAVEGAMTAAAWAIEGAGVLWISVRQKQWVRRVFAVLLQFAALVFLLTSAVEQLFSPIEAFFNGQFIAMVLIAVAMLFSSHLLSADFPSKRRFEAFLPTLLFITALVCLSLFVEWQLIRGNFYGYFIALHLVYAIVVALGLLVCQRFSYWPALRFALPLLYLLIAHAGVLFIGREMSLFTDTQWLLWPVVFLCTYAVLYRYQLRDWFPAWLKVAQVGVLWMAILLLSHEVHIQMQAHFNGLSAWYIASLPLLSLAVLWLIMARRIWPMRDYSETLLRYVGLPLAGLMAVWVVYSLQSSGESLPLFWLPLLNPLDGVTLLVGLTLLQLYRNMTALGHHEPLIMSGQQRSLFRIVCGVLAFTCLNMLVLRAMHHWVGLPWLFPDLLINPMTQTVLAIVWTLSGMLFTWQGSKLTNRNLWIGGAVLLVMVVLKLFMVDFASSGTLERIVSFISVGVLLLFVGYLAPIPPTKIAGDDEQAVDDFEGVDTLNTAEGSAHV